MGWKDIILYLSDSKLQMMMFLPQPKNRRKSAIKQWHAIQEENSCVYILESPHALNFKLEKRCNTLTLRYKLYSSFTIKITNHKIDGIALFKRKWTESKMFNMP